METAAQRRGSVAGKPSHPPALPTTPSHPPTPHFVGRSRVSARVALHPTPACVRQQWRATSASTQRRVTRFADSSNGASPVRDHYADEDVDIEAARELLEAKLRAPDPPDRSLWWAAIKPPMYAVAYVPIMVGAALAYYTTGAFAPLRLLRLCLASTFIIAWLNTSNDAFDAATGVDAGGAKPESLVALSAGNVTGVLAAAQAFLVAGAVMLAGVCSAVGDARVGYLLAAAITCGYLYQGPPFRLSYLGLGEPLCFLAFGPLAVTAFYLAQTGVVAAGAQVPALVWGVGCLVGVTTASILFCSHFHQIEGDTRAGKRSPLVRMGHQTATEVLRLGCLGVYAAAVALVYHGLLPPACLVMMTLTMPRCLALVWYAHSHHWAPERIRSLKFYAIRWHTFVGAALAAGLVAARWLANGTSVASVIGDFTKYHHGM